MKEMKNWKKVVGSFVGILGLVITYFATTQEYAIVEIDGSLKPGDTVRLTAKMKKAYLFNLFTTTEEAVSDEWEWHYRKGDSDPLFDKDKRVIDTVFNKPGVYFIIAKNVIKGKTSRPAEVIITTPSPEVFDVNFDGKTFEHDQEHGPYLLKPSLLQVKIRYATEVNYAWEHDSLGSGAGKLKSKRPFSYGEIFELDTLLNLPGVGTYNFEIDALHQQKRSQTFKYKLLLQSNGVRPPDPTPTGRTSPVVPLSERRVSEILTFFANDTTSESPQFTALNALKPYILNNHVSVVQDGKETSLARYISVYEMTRNRKKHVTISVTRLSFNDENWITKIVLEQKTQPSQ